ncbi:uncharacterized protein BO97DRAFT_419733 [Aspergillus homomorphus CBS 101889]|uniref:TPR-like protein n=1 Tax=Aspergillus homomorphus (strain CBS 101889) TaxID=1450537 RepID=A0A395IBX2_ASPHC|nr:hypothetical protein BO97DRAFT_419733 [Aspergillus homomorphus CBS 101889]RAL17495.1 hypothetical protein BO97DRAFT_419733 [Aspergillus homomorphus CBS 101889]
MFNISRLYWIQGNAAAAEAMYQQVLTGQEKASSADHASTIHTAHHLRNFYSAQGKFSEAGDDPGICAYPCRQQDNLAEAEALFKRVLSGRKKTLGAGIAPVLAVLNNPANIYRHQGKQKEAEDIYYSVSSGFTAISPGHPSALGAMNNLGVIYQDPGKYKMAERVLQQVLIDYEKRFNRNHISTLDTACNLGDLYRVQRKEQKAREIYQQAHAGFEKTLSPDHPKTRETVDKLEPLSKSPRSRAREGIFEFLHGS